jgi:hypothetical protein
MVEHDFCVAVIGMHFNSFRNRIFYKKLLSSNKNFTIFFIIDEIELLLE